MPTLDATDIQQITGAAQNYLNIYYVSSTGNDSNDGLTTATALATIAYASTLAGATDLIKLLPGVYNETGPILLNSSLQGSGMPCTTINVTGDPNLGTNSPGRISDLLLNGVLTLYNDAQLVGVRVFSSTTAVLALGSLTLQQCELLAQSDGTVGAALVALQVEGGLTVLRDCWFVADARGYSITTATAVHSAGQQTRMQNCHLEAIDADVSTIALSAGNGTVVLSGCRLNSGSGNSGCLIYDVSFDAGTYGNVSYMNSAISPAKVNNGVANLLAIDVNTATISGVAVGVDSGSGGVAAQVVSYAAGQSPAQQLAGYVPGGGVTVNQDTGGTDNLRVISGGVGVSGAVLRAYLASDWTANPLTATLLASTATGSDGRWITPIYLTTGYTYTIIADKPGVFTPQVQNISV